MKPTVAIIGASVDRKKFGNKAVRAHLAAGFEVFPIHPMQSEIEGLPVYKSLSEIPAERLDRVTVYVSPSVVLQALDSFNAKTIGTLILNPGTESVEVLTKAKAMGLNVVTGCSIIAAGVSPEMFPDE
ncbi:MAG: CoA-binding protein [Fimbriiglobus sp.]